MNRASWKKIVRPPKISPSTAVTSGMGARRRSKTRPTPSASTEPPTIAQLAATALSLSPWWLSFIAAHGGVEHQQGLMRRVGIDLLHNPDDLQELVHQALLVLQPAGGVDQHHVVALGPRAFDGVEGEARGVGVGRARHEIGAGALGP